jgi:TRAP-type C4-dicarboxylate transport system permease small subunit
MRPPTIVKSAIDGYYRLLQWTMTTLMGILIVPVTLQILSRYTGLIPRYIWTEEAARFCFMWIIMIGATIAVRDGTHFDVDVLPRPSSARGQALSRLLVDGCMSIIAVSFLVYGYGYAKFGFNQTSELTGINLIWIYGMYVVAGASWVIFLAERILKTLATLKETDHDAR